MRSVVEIGATVPAFLGKLWKLVNDSETNHLITWSPGGKTFVIKNQADFARELLPLYYKHNNMASFIRQLNMYGFHKITSVENGGLRYEKDEIEFTHPCFMRGHGYLLEHIKRKIANPKAIISTENGDKLFLKPEMMNKVLSDVKQMKGKQESMDAKFSVMKQENEALWREVAILRQKHLKQQQIVNNLIQFLMSLVQPSRSGNATANGVGMKRPYQLMINSSAHNSNGEKSAASKATKSAKLQKQQVDEEFNEELMEDGPTIHELAHDDILQGSPVDPNAEYISVELMPTADQSSNNKLPPEYHVTLVDGEDNESQSRQGYSIGQKHIPNSTSPIVTSPSHIPTSPIFMQIPVSPGRVVQSMTSPLLTSTLTTPGTSKLHKTKSSSPKLTAAQMRPRLSHFNVMNSQPDMKLPAEIFASDDSVSDAGGTISEEAQSLPQIITQNELIDHEIRHGTHISKDRLLNGNDALNFVIKPEPSSKIVKSHSKRRNENEVHKTAEVNGINIANIKTEAQDDSDWILATIYDQEPDRMQTVNKKDLSRKHTEEMSCSLGTDSKSMLDDQLDNMQSDLDSLRELLRSDSYALDTNTLLGLFGQEDPFYGLPMNIDEKTKGSQNAKKLKIGSYLESAGEDNLAAIMSPGRDDSEGTNQLMSYTGNIPDFGDFSMSELDGENSQDPVLEDIDELDSGSCLNTPQVVLKSPMYSGKK